MVNINYQLCVISLQTNVTGKWTKTLELKQTRVRWRLSLVCNCECKIIIGVIKDNHNNER